MTAWYFECGQCGHIGPMSELRDHPTRPVAMDIGFCPKCGREVEETLTEAEVRERLVEYDEDPDAYFATLVKDPRP